MNDHLPVTSPPRSICLFRLSALGDVCNHVPLVRALRSAWPDTRISWVIGKLEHRLVAGLEGVDFLPHDKHSGLAGWRRLRRACRDLDPDILLCTQVSARSGLLSLAVGARRRIGWDRARSREGHGLFINERVRAVEQQHQVEGFLEFARRLAIKVETPVWDMPLSEADREFAHREMPAGAVVISPCSSHPLRNWHIAGYAQVADWVIEHTGRRVVLMGGPADSDRETGAAIERAMHHRPVNLIGRDTLKQAVALLERAAVLIAPDSGPAHFAAATGTPVVGLYAATWSLRSGPWGSLEHCVDRFPEAARRFRRREPESLRWGTRIEQPGVMDLISVDDVIARLEPLLGSPA